MLDIEKNSILGGKMTDERALSEEDDYGWAGPGLRQAVF